MNLDTPRPNSQAGFPPAALLALATGAALLVAVVVAWLGMRWSQTTAELRAATASLDTVRASVRDRQQHLKKLISDRDEAIARRRAVLANKAAMSDGGSRVDASVAKAALMQPGKVPSSRPMPSATSDGASTSNDVAADEAKSDDVIPATTEPDSSNEVKKPSGPRVADGFAARLKGVKGKPVVLVEGLSATLPSEAITLSRQRGAGAVLPCELIFKKDVADGEVRISGKRVAKIVRGKETLAVEVPSTQGESQWLLEYLVLELRLAGDGGTTFVPFGVASTALLDVHEAQTQPDADGEKSVIDRRAKYELFSDGDANARLGRLLEAFPDLYESLEFAPNDLASVPGRATKSGKSNPAFTLVKSDGIGIQLRRSQSNPPQYQWSALVFPLQYGLLNNKYQGVTVFNEDLLAEIPRALAADIDNTYSYLHRRELRRAGEQDSDSLVKADRFSVDELRGRPVRLTLKKTGVDGGIVVVDSLRPTSPPSERPVP